MTIAAKQGLGDSTSSLRKAVAKRGELLARVIVPPCVIFGAAYLAPHGPAVLPMATLAAILCCVFLCPSIAGVPSHVWGPTLGAAALLVAGHIPGISGRFAPTLSVNVARDELAGHFAVPILILCHAYLSFSLDDSGFFNWCALKLLRVGRGSGKSLIVSLFLGISLITFFTSNDIVILAMTPILIYVGNYARIRNLVPFLMAQFIAANTASMGLYMGNPTNIVVGNAVGLGFVEYAQRMLVPTLIATLVALTITWLLFARLSNANRIPDRYYLPAATGAELWTRHMTIKVAMVGTCLVLLSTFANPWLLSKLFGAHSFGSVRVTVSNLIIVISLLCAVLAFVLDMTLGVASGSPGRRALFSNRMRRMPIEIVPFFLSFCLVLKSFEEAGLTRYAVDSVLRAFERGPLVGSLATGLYGVLAVNFMNNIPATILFEKMWLGSAAATPPIVGLAQRLPRLHAAYSDIFVNGFLFGSNFGANLTFIGALAGVMWLKIIGDHASRAPEVERMPTARDFLIYGVIIVPIVTVATCAAIAWCR